MAAFSDGAILAAETQERIARARAHTYRLEADHALTGIYREHFLTLARLQESIVVAQRCIIDSLTQCRSQAQMKQTERDQA